MNILFISAHPDDETLGCGGTILKHADQGDDLYWIIGTSAHESMWSKEEIAAKEEESRKVAQAYGMKEVSRLGFKAAGINEYDLGALMEKLKLVIEKIRPEIVYMVNASDTHTDHQMINKAAMKVLKPFRMQELGVRKILVYETISSTEQGTAFEQAQFVPTIFNDVSAYFDRKLEIMSLYASEVQPDPLPRGLGAIRALARYRGATASVQYAEAFMLIREIIL